MSSRRSRGSKPSRWDREETSRAGDGRQPSRKGPAGLIFMCNARTKGDCLRYKVLGLPLAKRDLVEQIAPGTFLFLYDIDVKELYGIFEAVSHGGVNLEPKAFEGLGSYPAQVRFDVHRECLPLTEDVLRDAIKENYYTRFRFNIELSSSQVTKLIQVFCPIEPPRKRLHVSNTPAGLQEAPGSRHGLGEVLISGRELVTRDPQLRLPTQGPRMEERLLRPDPLSGRELVTRDPQLRLPTQAPRMEERLPRPDPLLRLEPRPQLVDAPRLPQIKVLDERSDQKGLLMQGRLDEVDQLALKYLQPANPIGSALDQYRQSAGGLPLVEPSRSVISIQQQNALLRERMIESERLRIAAGERNSLRDLHGGSSSNLGIPSLVAARSQQAARSGSLRQSIGHHEARRRR